jgi:hypothetical protein
MPKSWNDAISRYDRQMKACGLSAATRELRRSQLRRVARDLDASWREHDNRCQGGEPCRQARRVLGASLVAVAREYERLTRSHVLYALPAFGQSAWTAAKMSPSVDSDVMPGAVASR